MNRTLAIVFSGFIWLIVGIFLLYKGLFLTTTFAPHEQALLLICGGLFIGFIKGRFVLSKTVRRVVSRICALSEPLRWSQIYSPSYLVLIGSMMLLGMGMRFLPLSAPLKGAIDVAIGSALINGSLLFFRAARGLGKEVR